MDDNTLNILITASDQASRVLESVGGSVNTLNKHVQNLAEQGLASMQSTVEKTADLIKTGLVVGTTAAVGAFGLLGKQAIENAAQFEQYRATLTVMLGSQEEANKRLQEYVDLGRSMPYQLPQVVSLGNQLQTVGKYSKETMIMLGDLASAAGRPLDQAAEAYTKLATGQKGMGEKMFRELLISANDWEAATGKGISKNGVLKASTEEMLSVLPKIMESKHFNGLMLAQMETYNGKMTNLMDVYNSKLREVGERILPVIKPYVDQLINFISSINLDQITQQIQNFANQFMQKAAPVIDWLQSHAEAVKAVLFGLAFAIGVLLVGAIATMVVSFAVAAAPFVLLGVLAGALYYLFMQNKDAIMALGERIYNVLKPAFDDLITSINPLWEALQRVWNAIAPYLIPILQVLAEIIIGVVVMAINLLITGITGWIYAITQVANFIPGAIDGIKNDFNSLANINLWQIGKNIMDGLANGISSGINFVRDKINEVANMLPDTVKQVLGIHSPSIVFEAIGMNTMKGLERGVDNHAPLARAATERAASGVIRAGTQTQTTNSNTVNNTPTFIININGYNQDAKDLVQQVVDALSSRNRASIMGLNNAYN